MEDIIERSAPAWFVFMTCYHVNVFVLATWFLIASPELQVNWKAMTSRSSRGASLNSKSAQESAAAVSAAAREEDAEEEDDSSSSGSNESS
jgi:hypothetical protein